MNNTSLPQYDATSDSAEKETRLVVMIFFRLMMMKNKDYDGD